MPQLTILFFNTVVNRGRADLALRIAGAFFAVSFLFDFFLDWRAGIFLGLQLFVAASVAASVLVPSAFTFLLRSPVGLVLLGALFGCAMAALLFHL